MTKKEESIVKHAVNCGEPKRRLRQFLAGWKSIQHKVHPVSLLNMYILLCICILFSKLKGIFRHPYCPLQRTSFVAYS